jgi:beta-glucanase (GH16 family)
MLYKELVQIKSNWKKNYLMMKTLLTFLLFILTHSLFAQAVDPYMPDSENPLEVKGMKLSWNDEFNQTGKPDSTSWRYEKGFVRNQEIQWYQPANANCANGVLLIQGRREHFNNPNYDSTSTNWKNNRRIVTYSSASINTRGNKQWLYGRFEIRARIDTAMGAWPAIWTLGTINPWPSNGEVDLMEFYRINNVPTILANVAWGTSQRNVAKWDTERRPLTEFTAKDSNWVKKFHVWRMDWSKDSINLYLDNVLLNGCPLSKTINPDGKNPFNNPQYILLNLALGSNGGDPVNTNFPIKFEVDYVRVYQTDPAPEH